MEERLRELLKLLLKYDGKDLNFVLKNNELEIHMRNQDSNRIKVKSKYGDYKLIRYLQYLANLDVGNILTPQTGELELEIENKLLRIRVAIIESEIGADLVLRILNQNTKLVLDSDEDNIIKQALAKENGIILITGPTGSGKSTYMYELLKSVKNKKIMTIEDPIEIYCDQFIQLAVNNEIGLDYSEAIKQCLRHEPDILGVKELRQDAIKMSIIASATGHLVVAEMHASSAENAIERLKEFGIDDKTLSENLICVSNQRLIIDEKGHKTIVKEVMDKDEINCFIKTKHVSPKFIPLTAKLGLAN